LDTHKKVIRQNNNKENTKEVNLINEIHCIRCGTFLGYEQVIIGLIKLRCHKCKQWTIIEALD
jgi:hypothetical protein